MVRTLLAVVFLMVLPGCRTAVTACGTEDEARESAWQLERAGIEADVERCGRGRLAAVSRWDAAEAKRVVVGLGLPRKRLEVPAPDAGIWPSASGREMVQRHESGRRAAAIVRGFPGVADAWVELRREGSTESATATVVMREGEVDREAVGRAIRGTQGFEQVGQVEVVGSRLPRVEMAMEWAQVGPFRVDAAQADGLRWLVAGLLGLLAVAVGLLAAVVLRRSR